MTPCGLSGTPGANHALFLAVHGLAMKIISPAVPHFVELFKSEPLRRLTLPLKVGKLKAT